MRLFSAIILVLLTTITVSAQNNSAGEARLFAYATYSDNDYDLHIMNMNSQEVIHSIVSPQRDCFYNFSPDNQYMLYGHGYDNVNQFNFRYRIMNLSTFGFIELGHVSWDATWSEDSQQVAYHDQSNEIDFTQTLYIYDMNSGEIREIAYAKQFQSLYWIGNSLMYATIEDNIVAMFIWDGISNQHIFSTARFAAENPPLSFLSPNGEFAIITVNEGDGRVFYISNLVTMEIYKLDLDPTNTVPSWHPDGNSFAIKTSTNEILVFDVLSQTSNIVTTSDRQIDKVQWSGDGSYISFREWIPSGTNDANRSIVIYDTLSQDVIRVERFVSVWAGEVSWISDSEFVYSYAYSESDALNDLFVYDMDGRQSSQLTNTPNLAEYIYCTVG